ncbi:MAG TPA: hypothetical protein VFQ38_08185 [Longimicrobiales bacterium]|nr:hypothetical protein [Longimicrobiales bacterium]
MSFLASIVTLLGVVCVIGVPYFVGHGLAIMGHDPAEAMRWIWTGIGTGVVAAAIIFVASRIGRGAEAHPPTAHR